MKFILRVLVLFLPWSIKRWALQTFFGYDIHFSARLGLSWIYPDKLSLGKGCRIGHFNVAVHLFEIRMGDSSSIGRMNWITGYPLGARRHFSHVSERRPSLVIGAHTAITKGHHIDCTDRVEIGEYSTVAGYNSQLLTHSIDVVEGRQHCRPIVIGKFCFVGTNVVILGGSVLPDFSVLGAKSMLNKKFSDCYTLYGGVPAKPLSLISSDARYFNREVGFVD